jgi:hypothetical protein
MKTITTALLLMLGFNSMAQNQDQLEEGKIISSYEQTISSGRKATVYLIVDNVTGEIMESLPTTAKADTGSVILFKKIKDKNYNKANHMMVHDIMARADY